MKKLVYIQRMILKLYFILTDNISKFIYLSLLYVCKVLLKSEFDTFRNFIIINDFLFW